MWGRNRGRNGGVNLEVKLGVKEGVIHKLELIQVLLVYGLLSVDYCTLHPTGPLYRQFYIKGANYQMLAQPTSHESG